MQILRATPATVSVTFSVDGTPTEPGLTTVTITRLDGTAIATDAATVVGATGVRSFVLTTAHTALLDTLMAVWESANLGTLTTVVEVVGDLLFTEQEARAWDQSTSNPLTNEDRFPDALIARCRDTLDQWFSHVCGVSFVPRYKRVVTNGNGRCELLIPGAMRVTAILSIETRQAQTWTAFTEAELADTLLESWGRLTRESSIFPRGIQNMRIGYEHGHAQVPFEVRNAALELVRARLPGSNIDSRTLSMSDGVMSTRFFVPGLSPNRRDLSELPWTSLVLNEYSERVPGIG